MIRVRIRGSRRHFLALVSAAALNGLIGCGGDAPVIGKQPNGVTVGGVEATPTPGKLFGVIPLPPAATATPTPAPIVIRFAHWEVGAAGRTLGEISDRFTRSNPRAIVQPEVSSFGGHFQKLEESLASGSGPDAFVSSGAFLDEQIRAEALSDLGNRITVDGIDLKGYWSEPIVRPTGGHLYALPAWAAVDLVFLNLDRLSATGVAPPTAGWTWSTFLEAARKATVGKPGEVSRWGTMIVNDFQGGWGSFVTTNKGSWLDLAGPKAMFDPAAVDALRWVADTMLVHHVAPNPSEQHALTRGGTVDPFLSGNVAIMPSGSWEIPSALNGAKFNWDVVAVPRATASGTSVAVGSVQPVCLAKSGRQVDLAWQFTKFLLGRDAQVRLATGKIRLPALKEVAADASTGYAMAPPIHVEVGVTAMETARDLGFTVGWQGFRAAVVSALDRAFDGRVSLEDGIATAVTNGNAALAKVVSPQ